MIRIGLATLMMCALASRADAQAAGDPAAYVLEYATAPMVRNAALAEVGVRTIERGADWLGDRMTGDLFTRRSTGGFFARLGRWALFDVFVAGYGVVATHEYGHAARAVESGRIATVHLGGSNGSFTSISGPPLSPRERMTVSGGGLEGESVLAARVNARIDACGAATSGDLTMLLVSVYTATTYPLGTLSERRIESPASFLSGGAPGRPGDPAQYVLGFTAARLGRASLPASDVGAVFADVRADARAIRRRSYLNLIDYGNVTIGVGLVRDYFWRGARRVPVRWIDVGPVALIPGLSYRLTPVGPETAVRTRFKVGAGTGHAYVRWTERLPVDAASLAGAGGAFELKTLGRIAPRVGFDAWRNPDGTASVRGEAAATVSRWPSDRVVVTAAIGAKGRGYLTGYPLRSGTYFSVGGGLRF